MRKGLTNIWNDRKDGKEVSKPEYEVVGQRSRRSTYPHARGPGASCWESRSVAGSRISGAWENRKARRMHISRDTAWEAGRRNRETYEVDVDLRMTKGSSSYWKECRQCLIYLKAQQSRDRRWGSVLSNPPQHPRLRTIKALPLHPQRIFPHS